MDCYHAPDSDISVKGSLEPRPAESPSPSSEIVSQKPPKRANCDTCLRALRGFGPGVIWRTGSYRSRTILRNMVANGEDCQACAAISEFLAGFALIPYTSELLAGRISVPIEVAFLAPGHTWTPEVVIRGSRQTYEFFTANVGSNYEELNSFDEPAPFPDHPMILRMRAPSGDTSSTEAFDTLKSWISRCNKEHTLCSPANDKQLPRRLLKIDGIRPLNVRLVEDYPLCESYACLSHRWGPQTESNSLKTYNMDLYKKGVPEENFYPLMKDAIEAAFRLDLRFIWIDCYCIIQDDIKDWEIAATQMGSIYENAFLTFSATFSDGGNPMFSTIGQPYAGIKVTEIEGEPVFLRQRLRHPRYPVEGRDIDNLNGPLLRRGWVFQERLLSNRFVHFTPDEIFWECRESTWCECTSRGLEFKGRREKVPRTIQNEDWGDLCYQYSTTELSFRKDKLPALAGIARRYAELHGLTYFAGIWKEELPGALTWFIVVPRPKLLEHVAPTWSCLSLPSTFGFDHEAQPDRSRFRFLGCNTQSRDVDIYAGADSLEITVEAPVVDLKIYKEARNSYVFGRSGNHFLRIEQDFHFDPEEPAKYRSVPEGSSCLLLMIYSRGRSGDSIVHGLLLLKIESKEGNLTKYERIGYYNNGICGHYVDDCNEFADYCGGKYPEMREYLVYDTLHDDERLWEFLETAETREITII